MTEITKELIDKLEAIHGETHLPLEKRLIDTAVWYHRNKDRIPPHDLQKRMDFMTKAFDIQLELTAMLVDRMQKAEGRVKSNSLWLPRGGTYTEDSGKKIEFN